jgi:nitrate/nitrite-specific signal transduction histidine kinase
VELHFIEQDLEEHEWYVELVADFIEDVELFVRELEESV